MAKTSKISSLISTLQTFSVICICTIGVISVEACNFTGEPIQLLASDMEQFIHYPGTSEENCNWAISTSYSGYVIKLNSVLVNLNFGDYIYVKDANGDYVTRFSTGLSEPIYSRGQALHVFYKPLSSGSKGFTLSYYAVHQYSPPVTTTTTTTTTTTAAHWVNMNIRTTTAPETKSKILWIVGTVAPIVGIIVAAVSVALIQHYRQQQQQQHKAVPFTTFRNEL